MRIPAASLKAAPALKRAAECDGARWEGGDIVVPDGDCYRAAKKIGLPPAQQQHKPAPAFGPGAELKRIIRNLGAKPKSDCQCEARAAQMNVWGVAGCRENFDTIVGWLRESYPELSLADWLRMPWRCAVEGINVMRPCESIVELAIARAEAKEQAGRQTPFDAGSKGN